MHHFEWVKISKFTHFSILPDHNNHPKLTLSCDLVFCFPTSFLDQFILSSPLFLWICFLALAVEAKDNSCYQQECVAGCLGTGIAGSKMLRQSSFTGVERECHFSHWKSSSLGGQETRPVMQFPHCPLKLCLWLWHALGKSPHRVTVRIAWNNTM